MAESQISENELAQKAAYEADLAVLGKKCITTGVYRGIKYKITRHHDVLAGYTYLPETSDDCKKNLTDTNDGTYEVHMGLTFHNKNTIGFDTGHMCDYSPMRALWSRQDYATYRDVAFVRSELFNLIDQIIIRHNLSG